MTPGPDDDGSALVRAELEQGLPELEPIDFGIDFRLADGPNRAIAWTYTGRPKPGRTFLGVQLTDLFTLRGVTLVQPGPDEGVLLRWYIDWLDALNKAGLNAALRPVPDGPQFEPDNLLGLVGLLGLPADAPRHLPDP